MRLHVFNPEHDMALAHGDAYFTPPRAGRQMRHDLGFLPLLWAADDDVVLLDDTAEALQAVSRLQQSPVWNREKTDEKPNQATYASQVGWLENYSSHLRCLTDLVSLPLSEVCPWGWDAALVLRLVRAGVPRHLMPTDGQLEAIRRLSSRRTAASLLPHLVGLAPDRLVGEAWTACSEDELAEILSAHAAHASFILKAPWSCSGRGLRQVGPSLTPSELGWARRILARQGHLMVEPRYDRLMDFGMEFEADGERIGYRGLSLFDTAHGAYTGNLLATEQQKTSLLAPLTGTALLATLRENIIKGLAPLLRNIYKGPLGVDMMLVGTADGPRVHPMVEINLRRTMGHVAIDMAERMEQPHGRMQTACIDGRHTLLVSS